MVRFRSALAALALFLVAPVATAQTPDAALQVSPDGEPTTPALFRVNVDAGTLAGGTYDGDGSGTGIPTEGQGARMMWYPRKAAFRAGEVRSGVYLYDDPPGFPVATSGTAWDAASIGDYSAAFGLSTRASASYTFAAGLGSSAVQVSAIAMGEGNTASGAASVALGYHAHTNARQGSFVFADRSSVDLLRAGVNHSANWRVSGGFRIFTSSNLSTGVTIQSGATTSNWGQTNAVISTSTGAYLSTGGVWTNTSDRNRKHHFEAVSGEDVLARLRGMDVLTWSYRDENDSLRHMGPMAQDFHAAFGLGGADSTHIATVDADGVALAAVQALEVRTRELAQMQTALAQAQADLAARTADVAALRTEIASLRSERDASETRLARIEAALAAVTPAPVPGLTLVEARTDD